MSTIWLARLFVCLFVLVGMAVIFFEVMMMRRISKKKKERKINLTNIYEGFGKLHHEINDVILQEKMLLGAYELGEDDCEFVDSSDDLLKCLNKLESSLNVIIGGMQRLNAPTLWESLMSVNSLTIITLGGWGCSFILGIVWAMMNGMEFQEEILKLSVLILVVGTVASAFLFAKITGVLK